MSLFGTGNYGAVFTVAHSAQRPVPVVAIPNSGLTVALPLFGNEFQCMLKLCRGTTGGANLPASAGSRLVSKQAAVACQCCCDGRIANVWPRLDENFLDFFQCEAVIEPGPHVDG